MPTAADHPIVGARLDPAGVDPAWAPPSPGRPPRPVRVGRVLVAVVVALGLLVGCVWALGGFERRRDVLVDTPTGTLISTGPYELRFDAATAQQRTGFDNQVTWRVIVSGVGRTTGAETIAPRYTGSSGMFVARDEASREVQVPQSQTFRTGDATSGAAFTPGLPLQPFQVQLDFSASYRPGNAITFVAYDLEFRDVSLLGNEDPVWTNSARAYRFELPLTVLAPALS